MPLPIAVSLCKEANVDFGWSFRYQYVISPSRLELPDFEVETIDDQFVHIGRDLRSANLCDSTGHKFGIVLGIAVDHNGKTPEEALAELILDANQQAALDVLEEYLSQLAGRYALIVKIGGELLYYCDPVGMIGAVYAPETRRIGATAGLCVDRPFVDSPLYDHEEIAQGNGTYGLSHTRDMYVHRMNGSHRFDLKGFCHKRFWPRPEDKFSADADQLGEVYDEIISAERNIISRMTQLGKTSIPLTGGNDSRILLALTAPEDRPKISQIFSHINNYANRRDSVIATALCRSANIPNEVHDRKDISVRPFIRKKAIRSYEIASGFGGPAPKEIGNGLFQSVVEGSIVMRGHQCNILRGQYLTTASPKKWQEPNWQIRMMRLVGSHKFDSEVAQRFTPSFYQYYNDLPENAKVRSADFIFFETLVPSALGILFPGQAHAFYLSPFNSRRLVQLCMMPDTAFRLTNATTNDLILRAAPEIFATPYSYEIPSDMHDSDESFAKRSKRCVGAKSRYPSNFGTASPDIHLEKFEPS